MLAIYYMLYIITCVKFIIYMFVLVGPHLNGSNDIVGNRVPFALWESVWC